MMGAVVVFQKRENHWSYVNLQVPYGHEYILIQYVRRRLPLFVLRMYSYSVPVWYNP